MSSLVISPYNLTADSTLTCSHTPVPSLPLANLAAANGAPTRWLYDEVTIWVDFPAPALVGVIGLAGLTGLATYGYWRVKLYSAPLHAGDLLHDSDWLPVAGTCAAHVLPTQIETASMAIRLFGGFSPIDLGRLWIGPAWSPAVGPSYGVEWQVNEGTALGRTEAGTLFAEAAPARREIGFDLRRLSESDRAALCRLIRTSREVFVSVYEIDPDPGGTARQYDYSMIGQFADRSDFTNWRFGLWGDRLVIRESSPWEYLTIMKGA